jgi:hypothetical protein
MVVVIWEYVCSTVHKFYDLQLGSHSYSHCLREISDSIQFILQIPVAAPKSNT